MIVVCSSRKSNMKYQTILYALALLVSACQSLSIGAGKAIEYNDRQHNHLDDGGFHSEDLLIRNVRRDQSENTVKPYLLIRSKPPSTLTVTENGAYTLECEVTGNPRPLVYWTKNGRIINQGGPSAVRIESEESAALSLEQTSSAGGRTLGLTLVKSRLFLDCISRAKHQAVYGCVAVTPGERRVAHSKVTVRPVSGDAEAEFSHQVLDSQATDSSVVASSSSSITGDNEQESKARTCAAIAQHTGSPARIFFWTATNLEYIGSRAVLHCRAEGSPRPSIEWHATTGATPDGGAILRTGGRFQILPNGDLHIRNITFDDMGKYRCVAENANGVDTADNIFLYPTSYDDKEA